ncbi:hypothetical protein LP123_08390 [Moraxella bovis]|uniref:Uncharacterized protein n=2 Tax=Moraxella bovis TaxID=476 RepID=A0AAQ2SYN5_MORBO|nr:hypothetical protein [Moraxella bovis]AWY20511.1 hypothetical protein DQF64_08415 [Moraxella bovis]UYZ76812.1 hypothetical protein LP093_05885 [Moraxella bovis]UYZ82284.1 hypothetical protein LP113_06200 [Moraxella bovis]UYZ85720.1 hypothetical protein LP094_07975 [Moraxella bovis]UYZ88373.1 hypothetical protein LP114_07780 [Moraxella bovis]
MNVTPYLQKANQTKKPLPLWLHGIIMAVYAVMLSVGLLIGSLFINQLIFDDEYRNQLIWQNTDINPNTQMIFSAHQKDTNTCKITLWQTNDKWRADFKHSAYIKIYQSFHIDDGNIPCYKIGDEYDKSKDILMDNLVLLKAKKLNNGREPMPILFGKRSAYPEFKDIEVYHYHFVSGRVIDQESPLYQKILTNPTRSDSDKNYYKIKRHIIIGLISLAVLFIFIKLISLIKYKAWIKAGYCFIKFGFMVLLLIHSFSSIL